MHARVMSESPRASFIKRPARRGGTAGGKVLVEVAWPRAVGAAGTHCGMLQREVCLEVCLEAEKPAHCACFPSRRESGQSPTIFQRVENDVLSAGNVLRRLSVVTWSTATSLSPVNPVPLGHPGTAQPTLPRWSPQGQAGVLAPGVSRERIHVLLY